MQTTQLNEGFIKYPQMMEEKQLALSSCPIESEPVHTYFSFCGQTGLFPAGAQLDKSVCCDEEYGVPKWYVQKISAVW